MAIPIIGWARTPVAPVGGALAWCQPHQLAAPLVHHLLAQAGLPAQAVDAVVLGNALGAGGNPARLLALAAGLPEATPALTVDTQCCSGLDAITQACGLIALGQAQVVLAGGAEAWSRAPIRMRQPADASQPPQPYDQPPFAPWPERDPDMLAAAADTAAALGLTRGAQDAYAVHSHAQALRHVDAMREEIVPIVPTAAAPSGGAPGAGLAHDAFPRALQAARVARMPAVRRRAGPGGDAAHAVDCSLSPVAISPKADGAALVLLASPEACRRWSLRPRAAWLDAIAVGGAPEAPMLCAQQVARQLLQRNGLRAAAVHGHHERDDERALRVIELHDAFAAQGLAFADALGLPWTAINAQGGGLARGHPIGASGAIALVRALAQRAALASVRADAPDVLAMACVAGAGGLGSATLVGEWHEK